MSKRELTGFMAAWQECIDMGDATIETGPCMDCVERHRAEIEESRNRPAVPDDMDRLRAMVEKMRAWDS